MHIRLATGNGAGLRLLLLDLQPPAGDRVALEHLNGLGHLADLVATADAGHLDVKLAAGEIIHRDRHALQRPGDAAGHEHRNA